jgi:hypothetical protein
MTTISDERLDPEGVLAALEAHKAHKMDPGRKGCGIEKAIRAYLNTAQSLRAQGGVRVKPLEWTGEEGGPGKDIRAVVTPFMTYTVRHLDMDTFDVILSTDTGQKWFRHDNEIHASYAQAKAAAQADYERRALSSLEASPAPVSEHPDDMAVDRFAAAMKAKLAKKREEGRGGWENRDECSTAFLSGLLREHVEKGDPLDVGNLAMMLHQRGDAIAPAPVSEEMTLDDEELDTILAIGRNEQSGRVTNYELKELVRVYRAALAAKGGQ